jgi:hypothetical protein
MLEPLAGIDARPCDECPRLRLDLSMELSEPGRHIKAALHLDWALRCGLTVPLSEVTQREFLRLRLLFEERQKREAELAERDNEKRKRELQRGR